MNIHEIENIISKKSPSSAELFLALKNLSLLTSSTKDDQSKARELLFRLMDTTENRLAHKKLINALLEELGLYPYLEKDDLNFRALIAYEAHTPQAEISSSNLVFHRVQAKIYYRLMQGKNVVLSAPTSFGKSLIIDAMVATGKFKNILVIVPTIALMDETRRRLTSKYGQDYKVITYPDQQRWERNIYVLTQERALDLKEINFIDFAVIDEFYKLRIPEGSEGEKRAIALNQIFYRIVKNNIQFYLLGPGVDGISGVPKSVGYEFVKTDFSTVASEIHKVPDSDDRHDALVKLCKEISEPTIIFCKSPASANKVAKYLYEHGIGEPESELQTAVSWLKREFHQEWTFSNALGKGIGLHHGAVPRAVAHYMVKKFNEGYIDFLVCTSSLIEGVNTSAKNVVIFDKKIGLKNFDYFTFNNIKGRSGRMMKHFVGHVYLFDDPPQQELPLVNVEVFEQADSMPDELLLEIEDSELSDKSRTRLDEWLAQDIVPLEVLKRNSYIEPALQVETANHLSRYWDRLGKGVLWTSYPNTDQLKIACDLIWNQLGAEELRGSGVYSAAQLNFHIEGLRHRVPTKELIEQRLRWEEGDVDKAVEAILMFLRNWSGFHFPRYLLALERLVNCVAAKQGGGHADYRMFAHGIETQFAPPGVYSLEEYGLPVQISRKIFRAEESPSTVDEAIDILLSRNIEAITLDGFEREMLVSMLEGMRRNSA